MSASTIARWNAIPIQRIEGEGNPSSKRPRPDHDNDDDEDDISIVSRTPSPAPHDAMDVDSESMSKYDEYIRGPAREVVTVETKIKPSNKGFAMLTKMGWSEGKPLGLSEDGRVDPVPFQVKNDLTGLGKVTQDVRMIETTVSQRRELDSERQIKETEEQRRAREELVARRNALNSEISSTLKPFYCSLCDKQFKNVAQYDEHTNSYAHHHKARLKDLQANARIIPREELDKRKEKERKREEKELRKMAAAIGIKMPKAPSSITPSSSDVVLGDVEATHSGSRKQTGWSSVSSAPSSSSIAVEHPSSSSGPNGAAGGIGVTPAQARPSPNSSSGGWNTAPVPSSPLPSQTPSFRTGGWTSLDTGSSHPLLPTQVPLPPSPPSPQSAPPPPPLPYAGGWVPSPIPQPPAPTGGSQLPPPPTAAPILHHPPPPPVATKNPRSNWQQFQKSKRK